MSKRTASILYPLLIFLGGLLLLAPYHPEQLSHSDEGFYIQSPREMIKTGDFLIPRYNGQLRFQKPIFYYWIVAGAYKIFGDSERAARFTSALFGSLTLLVVFIALSRWKSLHLALFSVLGIASSYGFFSLSHYAITDITLNAFIVASLLLFWNIYQKGESNLLSIWLFFLLTALAFLTKGPPGIFIPLLTIILFTLFSRDYKALKPLCSLSGWWIFIAIALPWFLVLSSIFRQDYVNFFIHGESVTRFTHNHRSVIYLLASYLLLITPWVLFVPLLFNFGAIKRERFHLFLFSWILSPILFYALIPNRHSHYLLPSVIPGVMLMMSIVFDQKGSRFFVLLPRILFWGLFTTLCFSAAALLFVMPLLENSVPFFVLIVLISAGTVYSFYLRDRGSPARLTAFIALLSLLTLFTVHYVIIPDISRRPEDGFAKKINEDPFAKAIAYRWHNKRLLHILNDRRVPFAVDDQNLEKELIWPGETFVVTNSEEYGRISPELKSRLAIVDRKIMWNKKNNLGQVITKLAMRDYDTLKAELLLLRRR